MKYEAKTSGTTIIADDEVKENKDLIPGITLYSITNLVFNPIFPKKEQEHLAKSFHFSGRSFIIDLSHYQYFHTLHDKLGQYEFLKKYIPDLNLIFLFHNYSELGTDYGINFGRFKQEYQDALNNNDYSQQMSFGSEMFDSIIRIILDVYEANPSNTFFSFLDTAIFDEVIYFYNSHMVILEKMKRLGDPMHNPRFNGFELYTKVTIEGLRERFKRYMFDNPDSPKKIFISRSDVNRHYIKASEIRNKQKNKERLTEQEELDLAFYLDKFHSEKLLDDILAQRMGSIEIHRLAEKTAKDLGFEIILASGLTLAEQINLFYNADQAISWDGTGAYNGIWMKETSEFILLHEKHNYMWCYPEIVGAITNVTQLPSKKISNCIILPSDIEYLLTKHLGGAQGQS